MRIAHVLIGLLVPALSATALAQATQAAEGDPAQTSAAADGIVDEHVVREMLKAPRAPAEPDIREGLRHCDGTTQQMKICAAYRWTVQDMRLNRLYAKAPRAADGVDVLPSLARAQKAWLAYRDAQCTFEGEYGAGGGTAEGLYVLACKEALTQQQADRLEQAGAR